MGFAGLLQGLPKGGMKERTIKAPHRDNPGRGPGTQEIDIPTTRGQAGESQIIPEGADREGVHRATTGPGGGTYLLSGKADGSPQAVIDYRP